jgi:hypothetical protein
LRPGERFGGHGQGVERPLGLHYLSLRDRAVLDEGVRNVNEHRRHPRPPRAFSRGRAVELIDREQRGGPLAAMRPAVPTGAGTARPARSEARRAIPGRPFKGLENHRRRPAEVRTEWAKTWEAGGQPS